MARSVEQQKDINTNSLRVVACPDEITPGTLAHTFGQQMARLYKNQPKKTRLGPLPGGKKNLLRVLDGNGNLEVETEF